MTWDGIGRSEVAANVCETVPNRDSKEERVVISSWSFRQG